MSMTPEQTHRERISDIVVVDVSKDARDAARDRADARLSEELAEGGRIRRFAKAIWKGNLAKDYYRQKYIAQAHEHIEASQDVLVHEDGNERVRRAAMQATIDRFQSEYEEAIHEDAGESREILDDNSELTGAVKDLVREYAAGNLNDESIEEEFTRVVAAYREHSDSNELKGEGIVQLHNIIEVAQQVRSAVVHGESLDAVMAEFGVVSGEARTGVRSEAKYSRVEGVIDKLQKSKIGRFVPPELITAGVSITASALRVGSTKALVAAGQTLLPGIGNGIASWLRERKRSKDDRTQHSREMAQGKEFAQGARRREEMEATRYETVEANELRDQLRHLISGEAFDEHGNDALSAALDALTRTETLIRMSDQQNIDLISYSDVTAVAEERFELDLARAEVKVALRDRFDDATRRALGLSDDDVETLIEQRAGAIIEGIEEDMSEKDAAFVKLRRRRAAKAAATGVTVGLVFGMAAQEAFAIMSDTRAGVVDSALGMHNEPYSGDGRMHNTLLNGLIDGDHGSSTVHHDPSSHFEKYDIGNNGKIMLPDDYKLIDNGDHTISIIDPTGNPTISSLPVYENGGLTPDAKDMLRAHGMTIDNISHNVQHTRMVDVDQYINAEHNGTTHVARDLWYDNDTPKPVFDQNELGMSWGGEGSSGVTQNGDFSFTVAGMQADGSFHGDQNADWAQQAQEGNLKLAVSASKDTQAHAFMLDIKPNGEVIIPKDSPAAALFSNENGHAVFHGAYAETVQVTGHENGVTHIRPLATVVGENNPGKIPLVTEVHHPGYKITPEGYTTTVETSDFTEMAPTIPVEPRRSLEQVRRVAPAAPERSYYYSSQYGSSAELERVLGEVEQHASPRLVDNPDASLNLGEETEWYERSLRESRGDAYVDGITSVIRSSPELSRIENSLESIITIPVKASGKEEAEGIYDLLRTYAQQDPDSLSKNLILLHVNWPANVEGNPDDAARIQQTKDMIEQAKRDFPGLQVATIESRWSDEQRAEGLIGHVADKMRDAALLSLRVAIAEGRMEAGHDVQIIRNDADARGIHKNYLRSLQRAFRENGSTDVFTGTTRFDEQRAGDLPGMVLGQHFAQTVDILESSRQGKIHTGGANFGVRASTLSAIAPVLEKNPEKGVGSDDVALGRVIAASRARNKSYTAGSRQPRIRRFVRQRTPYYGSEAAFSDRKVAVRVAGAQIDTDSQRSEEVYLLGGNFHNTWDGNFDDGGHRERGQGMDDPVLAEKREELKGDVNKQIEKLQDDMNYTIRIAGGPSNPAVRTALTFMFAGLKQGGDYSTGIGYVVRGGKVEFTPDGRRFLANRIDRDARGRFDQLGSRLSRQLYGQVSSRSTRSRTNAPLLSVR